MVSGVFLIKDDGQLIEMQEQYRLNKIPGIDIPEEAITKRPSISLSLFKESAALKQLLDNLDWVVQEIKAS